MTKIQKSISLSAELWKKIDEKRGDVSRSRFLATIVAEALDASKKETEPFVKVPDPKEVKKIEEC